MMGFTPTWSDALRRVVVGSPFGEITIYPGPGGNLDMQTTYTLTTAGGITLTYTLATPLIHNDRTYVPLAFFSEVFGFTNAWFEGGQVHLDNAEQMQ
jgi:hypothetical protein